MATVPAMPASNQTATCCQLSSNQRSRGLRTTSAHIGTPRRWVLRAKLSDGRGGCASAMTLGGSRPRSPVSGKCVGLALVSTLSSLAEHDVDGLNNIWQFPFASPWILRPIEPSSHVLNVWVAAVT